MNARVRAALVVLCPLILIAHSSPLSAQTLVDTAVAARSVLPSGATQHVGPTRDALAVGVHPSLSKTTAAAPSRGGAGVGQPEAMMIVGGAAILVGAIIGDDAGNIFMIGGAIVGLVGLYKYLQ